MITMSFFIRILMEKSIFIVFWTFSTQSAKSGLVHVSRLNDRTEVNLPVAEIDDRSRSGPIAPVSRG